MASITLPGIVHRLAAGPTLIQSAVDRTTLIRLARIDLAHRHGTTLRGFQRPPIKAHIARIATGLRTPAGFIANPLILGLSRDVPHVVPARDGVHENAVTIQAWSGPPALLIDGQQRYHAVIAAQYGGPIPITLIDGLTYDQMRAVFIRVNSVKPLAQSLLAEILASVVTPTGQPDERQIAAAVSHRLATDADSPLMGLIGSATGQGPIRDLPLQSAIMGLMQDGWHGDAPDRVTSITQDLKAFFAAVRHVFRTAFDGHTARTSRLLHGAGIRALLRCLYTITTLTGRADAATYAAYLAAIAPDTAWTAGTWQFPGEPTPWSHIQNLHADQAQLTRFLVRLIHRAHANREALAA